MRRPRPDPSRAAADRAAVAPDLVRVEGSNEGTIGFEGGYRISQRLSIGAVLERAQRARESTLYLLGVGWHPLGSGLRLQIGVGQKDPRGSHESVLRTGLAWEFELGQRWFAKPYLAYDMIEGEANETVLGVYLGRAF